MFEGNAVLSCYYSTVNSINLTRLVECIADLNELTLNCQFFGVSHHFQKNWTIIAHNIPQLSIILSKRDKYCSITFVLCLDSRSFVRTWNRSYLTCLFCTDKNIVRLQPIIGNIFGNVIHWHTFTSKCL